MKSINFVVYASVIFLLSITIAGAYFYEPKLQYTMPPWVPAQFLNRTTTLTQWGDLTRYNITIDCDLSSRTTRAPVISYTDAPMTEEQLRTIAADLFGMNAPEKIDDNPPDGIWLKQTHRDIRLNGQRVVYMASALIEPFEIQDWDQAEVRRIADEVIASMEPYWGLPTDAIRRVSFIGPTAWHNSDKWIMEFSVRYVWSVQGIDIVGNGCTVSVSHTGDVVVAIYNEPAVYVVGEQRVTVTEEDAVAHFIKGQGINSVLGVPRMMCIPPETGSVVINDVGLVYYPLRSPDGDVEEVLVYRIEFEMFSGQALGDESVLTAVEYEYAN
ncbi:MAG: hypothetical protein NTV61_02300 [Candidatus Bathyarchaeota archaeon]|nr:hypothetical protein [Candidatus Bathyarchaeota archaeon]